MTTRALVETSVNSAITTPDELIYVLEDEIKAGNDNNVARIIKGLIEMNDKKGKELATKLFMNEDLDPHLRIYVARKLCDSGHWDRQIISYFRNYEKGGKREKPVVDIKIDSLSAIINQMHTTPNIEIYKILEKTRLALDREKTNKLAQFGNTIFQIPDTDLKEKLEIFSVWSEEFNDGKLNDEKIAKLTETFIKLSRAEQKYYSTHNIDHRNPSIISKVKEYYKHKNILYTHESICQLLENGVFPTQPLIELSKQEPHSISLTLSALKNRTDDGFFDPGNIIQRDIEYTKYMMLMGDKKDVNYTSFSKLEHKKEETELRELTLQEQKEAEAASFEAARVFWLIKDRIDQGKKVTVVGNRRYGDNFVVEPLRYYLEEIGAQVSSYKIGSSGTNENTIVDVFPESFINGLIQETPDIFIVDGTPNFLDKNSNPRMPASINAYINWFYAFNEASGNQDEDIKNLKNNTEYNMLVNKILEHTPVNPYELSFYPESDNEQIVVGTYVVKKQNLSKRNPRVTMINAVVDPNKDSLFPEYLKEHKPGYLDDPDQYVRGSKQVIMFTNNGIRQTHIGRGNEAEFVNSIQNHMINVLPRMIRATDPFFT